MPSRSYGLDPDEGMQQYVRAVGAALVELSDRVPATYGGWHFAVLDTDIANGICGPGGFVLVTRGAVKRCRDEEELAGILAHEIAHVSLRHGEAILRSGPGLAGVDRCPRARPSRRPPEIRAPSATA